MGAGLAAGPGTLVLSQTRCMGIDRRSARIKRMPADCFRKSSALIRLIRGIRGLLKLLESRLVAGSWLLLRLMMRHHAVKVLAVRADWIDMHGHSLELWQVVQQTVFDLVGNLVAGDRREVAVDIGV